ncbi:uncharacterized protein LOC142330863 [Lycorma delicatula]|uniref:uncharacterized protein LOC142330863 n=1 Tax=Lycorma delicatula TaxID=130591 RepID=UPI003F51580D
MRKEVSGHVVGSKRASRSSTVHSKPTVKRALSEGDSDKKKKSSGVATASLPLAVVVVEVQRGKSGGAVDPKVKKKSVSLKTLPVKKLAGARKISGDPIELKSRQMKPKKDVGSSKLTKLKAKKIENKTKKVKSEKKKLDKVSKKQPKKIFLPNDTPHSPVTVVITEPEPTDVTVTTGKKPKLLKKQNALPVKKIGVASGKIGKRKTKTVNKMVAVKQVRKIIKKEITPKRVGSLETLSVDVNEDIVQTAKKGSPGRKPKIIEKSDLAPKSPSIISRELSPLHNLETKISGSTVKNVTPKSNLSDKKPGAKKKQTCKNQEDLTKKLKNDIQNGEIKDSASDLVTAKKETKKRVVSKIAKKLKSVGDSKATLKCNTDGKISDVKPGIKKGLAKKTDIQTITKASKPKPGTLIKQKKSAKSVDSCEKMSESNSEKQDVAMDHSSDSSTSDEIPLQVLKKQQICKIEPTSEIDSKAGIAESNIVINEDTMKTEESDIKIKKEVISELSSSSFEHMEDSGDDKTKSSNVKKDISKDVSSGSDKKNSKPLKNAELPKKLVEKKTKKEPASKPKCTVKVGVKGKKPDDNKTVKNKPESVKKPIKSDDDSKVSSNKKPRKDNGSDSEKRARRMKLFGFWSGPKRHRVASLNALAKVHCLYENESRNVILEVADRPSTPKQTTSKKSEPKPKPEKVEPEPEPFVSTRTLRSAPGLRSVGRHYDILNASSTTTTFSSSEDSSDSSEIKKLQLQPSVKQKQRVSSSDNTSEEEERQEAAKKKTGPAEKNGESTGRKVKKRRKRNELMMDLKDMVVRKRMASLNASAILAASYSLEKRSSSSSGTRKDDSEEDSSSRGKPERKRKSKTSSDSSPDMEVEDSSCEEDVLIRGGGSKQKVAVIVNQDTDVTITGVYVNSTTRSTHHEGFCSIAGMQYRISSTSHTQTEATAVATETVLHADHNARETAGAPVASPCKSYTPLGALSSMQPPGQHRPRAGPPSPLGRRHSCTSAFSAPPTQQDPAYVHASNTCAAVSEM